MSKSTNEADVRAQVGSAVQQASVTRRPDGAMADDPTRGPDATNPQSMSATAVVLRIVAVVVVPAVLLLIAKLLLE